MDGRAVLEILVHETALLLALDTVAANGCWLLDRVDAVRGRVGFADLLGAANVDRVPLVVVAALGSVALEEDVRQDGALEHAFTADDRIGV